MLTIIGLTHEAGTRIKHLILHRTSTKMTS